jgi:hypothetical protein
MQSKNKIAGLLLALAFPAISFAASWAPSYIPDGDTPLYFDTGEDPNTCYPCKVISVYAPDGATEITSERGANNGFTWAQLIDVYDVGEWHGLLVTEAGCNALTETQCVASPGFIEYVNNVYFGAAPPFQVMKSGAAISFLSGVGSGVKSSGSTLWEIVAIAIAIPLAFYTLHAVIGLFPKKKRR